MDLKAWKQAAGFIKEQQEEVLNSRTQFGKLGVPGEKVTESGGFTHRCGGSIKYY